MWHQIDFFFSLHKLKIANKMKNVCDISINDDDIIFFRRTFNTLSTFFCHFISIYWYNAFQSFIYEMEKSHEFHFEEEWYLRHFNILFIIIMKLHIYKLLTASPIKFRLSFSQKKTKKKKKTNNNYTHINISFHTIHAHISFLPLKFYKS